MSVTINGLKAFFSFRFMSRCAFIFIVMRCSFHFHTIAYKRISIYIVAVVVVVVVVAVWLIIAYGAVIACCVLFPPLKRLLLLSLHIATYQNPMQRTIEMFTVHGFLYRMSIKSMNNVLGCKLVFISICVLPLRRKNPLRFFFFQIRNALHAPSEQVKLWWKEESSNDEKKKAKKKGKSHETSYDIDSHSN